MNLKNVEKCWRVMTKKVIRKLSKMRMLIKTSVGGGPHWTDPSIPGSSVRLVPACTGGGGQRTYKATRI